MLASEISSLNDYDRELEYLFREKNVDFDARQRVKERLYGRTADTVEALMNKALNPPPPVSAVPAVDPLDERAERERIREMLAR
jgi:hypothetical protein